MSADLTAGIARILSPGGTTAGTGFLVTDDGLIATCAHVVEAAGAGPGDTVRVVFHATGEEHEVQVEPAWWRAPDAEDVAILHLDGPLPEGVTPLPLGSSAGVEGHALSTFGFPDPKPVEGMAGKCEVVGRTTERGFPVLQLRSSEVTPGFSGAPVLDTVTRRVVGMVTAITVPDRHGRLAETAFITPTETLRAVCPALQVSDVCPYRSLDAFTEADAEFFFGRGRAVERLVESLRRGPRFLAVLGPSGSGKSSLVQAGLIPQLRQVAVPGSDRWGVIVARPADQPLGQLEAQGLAGASEGLAEAVGAWLDRHPEQTRLVLVVDQFEELLTSCPEEVRQAFVAQLTELLDASLPVTVVPVMRDDFYGRFAREARGLLSWLERGLVNVPSTLARDELRAIVEEPARAVGLDFESGLVEAIVENAMESAPEGEGRVGRSTVLPLLEFALTQLWERREDGVLTHEAYGAIGGVTGGLTQWADRAFYGLEEEQQGLARRVLTDLVHLGDESQGLPDSQRRRLLDALCRGEGEREAVHRVVRQLADARLLVTGRDLRSGQETVELIHDALLREWGLLQRWLRDDRRFLAWRQALEGRVRAWMESAPDDPARRDTGRLLRGRDLAEAERWLEERGDDLRVEERALIEASAARAKRVRRLTVGRVAFAFLVVSLLAFLALWQWSMAEDRLQLATSRELAMAAVNNLEIDPERSILLAMAAVRIAHTFEAEDALRQALLASHVRTTFRGHEGAVLSVAFKSDGRWVVTTGNDGTARVWDATTGRELAVLGGREGSVGSAMFSPDGRWVVTAEMCPGFEPCPATARVWEAATGEKAVTLRGHEDAVRTAAFSPDGRRVVTASDDSTARMWKVDTGRELTVLRGHEGSVCSAVFSPDGRWVVTASDDGTARVWEVATGRELAMLRGHKGPVNSAVFSPNGRWVVTSSRDSTTRLWEAATGQELAVLRGHEDNVWSAAFSPDGRWVVTASDDSTARVWDAATGEMLTILRGHKGRVWSAVFSSDRQWVVTACSDTTARVWDAATGETLAVLHGHGDGVWSAEFSPNGRWVVTAGHDGTARLWEVAAGGELAVLRGHENWIRSAAFSPDGQRVVTASYDGTARVWEVATGRELAVLRGHEGSVCSAVFGPNGRWGVTASDDNTARVWEVTTGRELAVLRGHEGDIQSASFSPEGQWVVTASWDGTARVWEATTGQELTVLRGHESDVQSASFSPDGQWVVTASNDNTARVWDSVTGEELAVLRGHKGWVRSAAFSPNGQQVVTASSDGTARVWDMATGQEMVTLRGHEDNVWSASFSPDGQWVVTASSDGTARVWDAATGQELAVLRGHEAGVNSAVFGPDGHWVVTASGDDTARIFDSTTGRALAVLRGHEGWFWSGIELAAFSPDGRWVVTAGSENTARIYATHAEDLLDLAQQRVTRGLTCQERVRYLHEELDCTKEMP